MRPMGFKPTLFGFGDQCFIQLSYERIKIILADFKTLAKKIAYLLLDFLKKIIILIL